jgi:hypothetical protein
MLADCTGGSAALHPRLLTIAPPGLKEFEMATQEKDLMCESLVRKITTGESLDDAEKSHLAECEGCMSQVVRSLDESAAKEAHGLNGDVAHARPEAKKALEQGRRVFEREFGISLSEK